MEIKRFGQIIICSLAKSFYFIINIALGRGDDDGNMIGLLYHLADRHPIDIRQHEIQEKHIVYSLLQHIQSYLTCAGSIALHTFMLEIGNYVLSDRDIVFDEEETHREKRKKAKRVKRRKEYF